MEGIPVELQAKRHPLTEAGYQQAMENYTDLCVFIQEGAFGSKRPSCRGCGMKLLLKLTMFKIARLLGVNPAGQFV